MANRDIRINVDFWDHAKVQKLWKAIGPEGPISLQRLWCYVAKNRPTGNLLKMTASDIEIAAKWNGKEGVFFNAIKKDWLDFTRGRYWRVHDWGQHNPWAAASDERAEYSRKGAHETNHVKKGKSFPSTCKYCRSESNERKDEARSDRSPRRGKRGNPARGSAGDPGAPAPIPAPAPIAYTRAREAADAWNERAGVLKRKPATEETVTALSSRAEEVTAAILELRSDFTWPQCIARIAPSSWLVREAVTFSFEWLFKRDQHRTEWNAIKVWDGRLGGNEDDPAASSDTDNEGRLRRMVL
jgi:hypothetical protein